MQKIIQVLKKTMIGKMVRKEKWKRRSKKSLLSKRELNILKKNSKKWDLILKKRLDQLPKKGRFLLENLNNIIDNSELKNLSFEEKKNLKEDMLKWYFAYGYTFNEYISYQFFKKTENERFEFLSEKDMINLCYEYNDIDDMSIISDKSKTYNKFKTFYKRDAVTIDENMNQEELRSFLISNNKFIKKNIFEACGRSIEIIKIDTENENIEDIIKSVASNNDIILEELVTQSEDLAEFNSTSVNTLRCITFNTKQGIMTPFFFMRFGREGKFIDNGAAGGLIVEVNKENGTLGEATDEYGNRFKFHPDSGKKFVDFKIPDWEKAIELCKQISTEIPTVHIIGWDLAHTKDGWVIIEGNSMTEVIGPQSTMRKGIRGEIEKIIKIM